MVWPAESPTPAGYRHGSGTNLGPSTSGQSQRGFATQGTQTSPSMAGQPTQHPTNGTQHAQQSTGGQQPQPQKSRPRRTGKEYALAARQRRLQQEYNNYHHPPSGDDVWICEFCEYESIFGTPPAALIRQYEIKDRRERRRLAEKRRLLEKAKMKGRKGKKGSKNAAKNAAAAPQPASHQARHDQHVNPVHMQHQGTQSEEHLAEDYDDNPIPFEAPLPQPPVSNTRPRVSSKDNRHSAGAVKGVPGGPVPGPASVAT